MLGAGRKRSWGRENGRSVDGRFKGMDSVTQAGQVGGGVPFADCGCKKGSCSTSVREISWGSFGRHFPHGPCGEAALDYFCLQGACLPPSHKK